MVMNPSKVAGHARFLLESFSDSEVDSIAQEICHLVDYGIETSIPVLKTCLDCFAALAKLKKNEIWKDQKSEANLVWNQSPPI
ncbi:BnaC05g00130D [Brassica napus]|uniref:(rape) hypothetical protein n=1 Tax=Brassica napus TaxID=3708 RepID=A0A078FQI7_BRANA|nr:unnamed protein product [Brassica napus]CDY15134.1 BnaC05g00130D [Brassica napus]